jgi:uncharacterized membrane protein (UPF0127 family)
VPNSFISENPIVAKIQYWMKITFIFILILFIDSVNRVYRVQVELAAATKNEANGCVQLHQLPTSHPCLFCSVPPLACRPSPPISKPALSRHAPLSSQSSKSWKLTLPEEPA